MFGRGFEEGGGGSRRVRGGGGGDPGGAIWGGRGGGGGEAPLTSTCPPSNHSITINLTITIAAGWFGHASHNDWAEQDFVHGPKFRSWLLLPHHCCPLWTPHNGSDPSLGSELGLRSGSPSWWNQS